MKVIEVDIKIKTTADCTELLNRYDLLPTKWKRTYKVNLSEYKDEEIRVFKNEDGEYKTLVSDSQTTRIFTGLNFQELMPLIKEITRLAKYYYTHDYGAVFLNPLSMNLYIEGGDGGYMYSTKTKSTLQKLMDEGELDFDYDKDFVEFNQHESLKNEINSVEWEAEARPDNIGFIEICTISLLD